MSYSDDLDWLARNVHEWPAGHQGWCFVTTHASGAKGVATHKLMHPEAIEVTIDQWLARRAELQGKPSWADGPEWAEWLAQDSYGCWGWFQQRPVTQSLAWLANSGYYSINSPGHLVLDNWRDTLEQRPDMYKNHEEIDTSAERVQETAKSMRDWHERGELPPVGTECVIWSEGRFPPAECKIVAYSMEQVCVRWNGNGDLDVIDLQFKNPSECKFRPLRTERDELIAVIVEAMNHYDTDAKVADAILAAGFKREVKHG